MENFATDAYWNFAVMYYRYYTRHVLSLRSTKSDPISQVNGRLRKNVSCMQRMPIYTVYNMKVQHH